MDLCTPFIVFQVEICFKLHIIFDRWINRPILEIRLRIYLNIVHADILGLGRKLSFSFFFHYHCTFRSKARCLLFGGLNFISYFSFLWVCHKTSGSLKWHWQSSNLENNIFLMRYNIRLVCHKGFFVIQQTYDASNNILESINENGIILLI